MNKPTTFSAIRDYFRAVARIKLCGGEANESTISPLFYQLLNSYAQRNGLMMVSQLKLDNSKKRPDGTLKDSLRQDRGHWESKDEKDDLEKEIENKFSIGYPKENILFENSKRAILIQNGQRVREIAIRNDREGNRELDALLTEFVSFETPALRKFHEAIRKFSEDIPDVTDSIRLIIDESKENNKYIEATQEFLDLCKVSINPNIRQEDVEEMIIQHILTQDIFNKIFDDNQFHRENNIARKLTSVVDTFFKGDKRRDFNQGINYYYDALKERASSIADHHEKQKFLKVIYEEFYKSYNPDSSKKLGVVYTPNEIVQFMIKNTDYLLKKHFNQYLEDEDVEILDPATGTGTFITELIKYISESNENKLEHKYLHEISANEVSILPYYISNLNIEYTYSQIMGKYTEFKNLCFVDTLDNMRFRYKGKQETFELFSEENSERIERQNKKKISVIIGNPPYRDNNRNRKYPLLYKHIKNTFAKHGTAQNKNHLYDMYVHFYRWAFDRLNENGIIAFITNNSFIEAKAFDGFRKCVSEDFEEAYIIDLGGESRLSNSSGGNVFDIRVGVAIMFLIKKACQKEILSDSSNNCRIHYLSVEDALKKEEKLQWLNDNRIDTIKFDNIRPNKKHTWRNQVENDFETHCSITDIFSMLNEGVSTHRDKWVYDFNRDTLIKKAKYFITTYNHQVENGGGVF